MPSNSTGFVLDAIVSGSTEFHVPTDQTATVLPVHTATFCRTNFLSTSYRITGRDIPARSPESAAIKPRDTTGELDVWNAPLPPLLRAIYAHYAQINITWDELEHQNAGMKQCSDEQHRVQTSFVCSQQGVFQVPSSLTCDYFCLASFPKVFFVDVFAR